jgi:phosphoesterase RecJ-like protein
MSLKKLVACIKRNRNFLITSHINLEGDALGSELAFYRLLKSMGKSATILNADGLPHEYDFLPNINKINRLGKKPKDIKFDCLVVLDCSDLGRCGGVSKLNSHRKPVLNIDHHISNKKFGDINWVDAHFSSTSEMVYRLYKELGLPLNREVATFLYVGILTDTGGFRYPNTTSLTHEIVSHLLKYSLDISQIYKKIYEDVSFEDMKLLSKMLSNIRRQANGKIAWLEIRRNMLKDRRIFFDLNDYILSFARAIKDVEVVVLFKEELKGKSEISVNLRSRGKVDVNRIASFFGGGGHRTASGCTIPGKIGAVRKKVLAKIRESLR